MQLSLFETEKKQPEKKLYWKVRTGHICKHSVFDTIKVYNNYEDAKKAMDLHLIYDAGNTAVMYQEHLKSDIEL